LRRKDEKMRIAMLVGTAGLALLSSTASAQSVTYDFDKGSDFSKFKSYAWATGTHVRDDLNHRRIVAAIDSQLAAKGLAKVESGANPDVIVRYHASIDRNLQINAFSSDFGDPRFTSTRTGTARVEEILTGTLVVDVLDARAGSIAWRGTASKELDLKASPERRDRDINRATEKLFKTYPPVR
jgi:hypothetical protein